VSGGGPVWYVRARVLAGRTPAMQGETVAAAGVVVVLFPVFPAAAVKLGSGTRRTPEAGGAPRRRRPAGESIVRAGAGAGAGRMVGEHTTVKAGRR
jgi:hypothetical protein